MVDAPFWQTYGNALSVYDPPGLAAGEIAPTIFSSNALVTIPNLNASNANVNTAFWANDIVTNGLRVNTTNASASELSIGTSNTMWTNTEFQPHAFNCIGGGASGTQYLYGGADGINMVGYLQSTGLGQFRPLVLNGRGGNVGIGTSIPSANLDVTGTIRATSDITAPNITSLTSATAFASDTAVWTSNALAITNANVASLSNKIVEASPSFTFDLGINLASMTSDAVLPIGDGAYPSSTPYFGEKMPIASGGWYLQQLNDTSLAFNNFTVARLNLRGTRDALFTFDPDLVTRLDIMYSSNFDPFVWQHLKNTGGSNASARFFSRGYNGGMSSAKSEWFDYPASMVNQLNSPLWLGLKIADASTQSTGFRLGSATMDVL